MSIDIFRLMLVFMAIYYNCLYADDDINLDFSSNRCRINYSITLSNNGVNLGDVLYEVKHLSKYYPITTIRQLSTNVNSMDVELNIKYLIYKNTAAYHRNRSEKGDCIEFHLLSSKQNLRILPSFLSSAGTYKISYTDDSIIMKYNQNTFLSKEPSRLYKYVLRKNAQKFIENLREYYYSLK